MATNEISGSDSESHCSSVASIGSFLHAVPDEILETIFQRLNASNLCHVASCSRWLRDAANQDSLWRPLCQSKGWEHLGTTTDLAKIASYGPSKQATGATETSDCSVTFQNDRIVTDDNTAGLTSTCRWKGVYMRAYHLHRNWAKDCCHVKEFGKRHYPFLVASVDGDHLAMCSSDKSVHIFDIRKRTLQCIICQNLVKSTGPIKIKDGALAAVCQDERVRVFDAKTGQMLQKMEECWPNEFQSLFFDGELVIASTYEQRSVLKGKCYIHVWGVEDGKRRLLAVDERPTKFDVWYDIDYRNKLLATVHSDNCIGVWDATSGQCLHELTCPRDASGVKLGDNVIVGFSAENDIAMCVIRIWSLNTGECQKEVSFMCDNNWDPYLLNNLIVINLHGDRNVSMMFVYDLRGRLVTTRPLRVSSFRQMFNEGKGSKYPFKVLIDTKAEEKRYKEFIFEATPKGLVRLSNSALDPYLSETHIVWMDDIRMIRYHYRNQRLLIYHYW